MRKHESKPEYNKRDSLCIGNEIMTLMVNDNGLWSLEYRNKPVFGTCGMSLTAECGASPRRLVFSSNYTAEGVDDIGEYSAVHSGFLYGPEAAVTRTIRLYKYKAACSVFVEITNNSLNESISLEKVMPIDGFLCLESSDTKILTGTWERYYGETCVYSIDENREVFSPWNVAVYCRKADISLAAGALSGYEMFTSIKMKGNHDGNADFTVSGDIRSGNAGVLIAPGDSLGADGFIVALDISPYKSLEIYSNLLKQYNKIRPKLEVAAGWADWYHYYGKNSEKTILENLEAIDTRLKGYGIEYIQVDDGWQKVKEYTYYEPLDLKCTTSSGAPWEANGDFSGGMKQLANEIHKRGYKAGLWIRPLSVMKEAEEFKSGVPWVLKEGHEMDGRGCIDMSSAAALEWLNGLFRTLCNEWGFDLVKYDFISYDSLGRQKIEPFLDSLPPHLTNDRNITSAHALHNALRAFRNGAGKDAFLLGVTCFWGCTLGLVDGYRISGDVCIFSWELTKKMLLASAYKYYQNNCFWQNDPDVLMVDKRVSINQAEFWASLVALGGGMIMLGDCMPDLPEERLDMLKGILPPYKGSAIPLRLFEDDMPYVWNLNINKDFGKWDVAGLFNWDENEREFCFEFSEIGADEKKSYLLFDFWKDEYLGIFSRQYSCSLPGDSCRILGIRELMEVPQVLSTRYHISQGGNELQLEKWDDSNRILKIVTAGVAGSVFKLYVRIPQNLAAVGTYINDMETGSKIIRNEVAEIVYQVSESCKDEVILKFERRDNRFEV